jgi:hypothetical protein
MTELVFGAFIGYLLGHVVSDNIWKGRFAEIEQDEEEENDWEEVVPQKHIRKRRRYS